MKLEIDNHFICYIFIEIVKYRQLGMSYFARDPKNGNGFWSNFI